jgi:ubiquinone/menaquinone biosynthesis C-methylase UbiE
VKNPSTSRRFGAHYTKFYTKVLFRWVDIRKRSLLHPLLSRNHGLRILDLGCGAGQLSRPCRHDHRVIGVDHDLQILTLATANGLIGCQASFEPLPFLANSFDLLLMTDSLEHVVSRERTAAEIKRVLRASGTFVAITPCYSSCLWVLGEAFANLVTRTHYSGHVSPFTRESLEFFMCSNFRSYEIGTLNFGMWLYGIGSDSLDSPMS